MPPYVNAELLVGDQHPRLQTIPDLALNLPHGGKGVVSRGSEAIDLAAMAGLELDPWQCLVLENMLALREDTFYDVFNDREENKWASYEFGLVVARQNGKGSILEARELAGLFLFGERTIIHSAHLFDTSREHFLRIKDLIEGCPDLRKEVLRISNSHGDEGIFLRSGQKLVFKARSAKAARGFSADLVVFDEAMKNLDSAVVGAALPTISARPNSQILYTGSAGTEESEHFGRVRNRALKHHKGESDEPRLCWMEWSCDLHNEFCNDECDEHDEPGDPRSWAKANPATGIRIEIENIDVEWRGQKDTPGGLEEFNRERLSVGSWPMEGGGWRVIPQDAWKKREHPGSELVGKFALAVDASQGLHYSCIGAVGQNEDGEIHCEITNEDEEIYDYRSGIKWVVPRVLRIWRVNRPAFVVIQKESPAGILIEELESHGVKVISPTVREFAQGCGDFKAGFAPKQGEAATHVHLDQPALNTAVAAADTIPLQDLWRFSKGSSAADITPLTTLVNAGWGYRKHLYRKSTKPWAMYV